MSSRGHPAIIIRAFSQASTSNAELLNWAHINILFVLLFIFHQKYWSLEIIYLLQNWSNGLVSLTQFFEERKKEKDGIGLHSTELDLDTRNHYQRVGGRDQHGQSSPCIDETISKSHKYTFYSFVNFHILTSLSNILIVQ